MMRVFSGLLFLLIFNSLLVFGQHQNTAFQSLDLPISARLAVLNQPLSILDDDVEMGVYNPALLNPQMEGRLALNFVDYFADINFLSASYAFSFKTVGTMALSVKSIGYGEFLETDYTSQSYGMFGANEQLVSVGLSKSLSETWQVGTSLKTLLSNLENYQSIAVVGDLAMAYTNRPKKLVVSLLAKNYGRQISSYTTTKEKLPFQLDIGFSKQLEHLPFLFSLGYKNIQKWNLTEPITYDSDDNSPQPSSLADFSKTFFSHIDVGGELTLFKYVQLRMGYNAKRRQDLKLNTYTGMVGFSWGIGIRFTHFTLNYGRSTYHLHGSPNYFSFSTDFSKFYSTNENN